MKKFFIIALLATACSQEKPTEEQISRHKLDVDAWYIKRVDDLKAREGWLNLAGLFWLNPGVNSFGSDESNDIVFPSNKIAAKAGYFMVNGPVVTLTPSKDSDISIYGQPVEKEAVVFHPDSADAIKRKRGPVTTHGSLEWYIIRREDKLGIRLRDLDSDGVKNFKGIDRYPVDYSWKIPAKREPGKSGETIDITNILGQTITYPLAATFVFNLDGKEARLSAIGEGERYFIIFGDSTNAVETYGAGRFLYISKADTADGIFVDFNKAENPPCAFTEFATCPLPPKQNVLPLRVTAGEKNYGEHTKQSL